MKFRLAAMSDVDDIMKIMAGARVHLKNQGINQWQGNYPSHSFIEHDILENNGYVLMDGDRIAGYLCVSFDGEADYDKIDGAWKSLQPFAVVHRTAIDDTYRGMGLSADMFQFAEQLCRERGIHSIKVDTHKDNFGMQHILKKQGYESCGVINMTHGLPEDESSNITDFVRVAFEKLLL